MYTLTNLQFLKIISAFFSPIATAFNDEIEEERVEVTNFNYAFRPIIDSMLKLPKNWVV